MKTMLFYEEPVALDRQKHKELKYQPITDYTFTRNVNSVPVSGVEFFEASRGLPILFSQDNDGNYAPLVLLSLKNDGHQQTNKEGKWLGTYVPAFIRRYPFVLTPEKTVCFDQQSTCFSEEEGKCLFDAEGKHAETLEKIIQFLMHYDVEQQRTVMFCTALAEQHVFKPFTLQVVQQAHAPLRMDGLYIIDDKKINNLADDLVVKWFHAGWIAWIYAHLHSLGAIQRLTTLSWKH